CGSSNLELIRNIGADNVIDYTKTDIFSISEKYDVIFDAVGKISKNICKNIMNKNSRYITVNSPTDEKIDYLNEINELFSNKKVRPIIDRIYSLDEIVEAHRYVDTGHKKGNVVIKMC
ncbi:MAG TPA: zinc-binding dehydrogenase, partial [Spirochaetota bacterium]|nr:zinc-binding dehydrogenase [Spirochaetota bacterium]